MKNLISQIIKFSFVGIIAGLVDIGVLMLLSDVMHIDVLVASAVSFSVSVVVNYILSMKYVFEGKQQSKLKEFVVFVILSIGGLCINQFIMWLGVKLLNIYYLVVKLCAMIFVPAYNFITRKIFIETKEK